MGWRHESLDKQRQVADAVVCNELSETTQIKRGVHLPGGIRKNAEYFAKAAVDGAQPGANADIAGSYFKRVESAAELKPGASLFWINTVWQTPNPGENFDNSNMVFPVDGVDWPMPFPPEFVKEWSDWDAARKKKAAWDKKPKGEDPGDPGNEPQFDRTTVPDDGEVVDDWTYTNTPGQAITRERDVDDTHHEKQWMLWLHQATVLRAMPDGRIFVLETTLLDPKDRNSGVTGFTEHGLTKRDLLSGYVYVGYIPGSADASAARP